MAGCVSSVHTTLDPAKPFLQGAPRHQVGIHNRGGERDCTLRSTEVGWGGGVGGGNTIGDPPHTEVVAACIVSMGSM